MSSTKVKSSGLSRQAKLAAWLFVGLGLLVGGFMFSQMPAKAADVVVYKSPTCGCCTEWVTHLEKNGFSVDVRNQNNLSSIKAEMGVPRRLHSCHTANGYVYVVEGHVPADVISRMLKEKPEFKGLAVAGMPMGSPGMEGPRKDPYNVMAFDESGKTKIYASR